MCYTHEEVRNAITHGKWWDGDNPGVVLKARGLAGGKGVRVCDFQEEALAAADAIVQSYGTQILVCEKLSGPEFSVFAICDGKKAWGFDAAFQDYKRLYDNDLGPNTGGMGAFGPVHLPQHLILQTHEYMQRVVEELEFTGFLYAGMMLTSEGPKCLEFNARFGDPECQPAMVLLENDLFDLLWKATSEVGLPKDTAIKFKDGYAVCVVLTDKGYPHKLRDQGAVIEGIRSDWHSHNPCCWIYHGGTEREGESYELKKKHVVSGGRVLSVVGYGDDPELARFRAYKGAKGLTIPGGFYHRKDIAK
jgi:phosphoribosylamine--glycine ligase